MGGGLIRLMNSLARGNCLCFASVQHLSNHTHTQPKKFCTFLHDEAPNLCVCVCLFVNKAIASKNVCEKGIPERQGNEVDTERQRAESKRSPFLRKSE